MPGSSSRGYLRSGRLWLLSKDRLGYKFDAGLLFAPWGILFSTTGCIAICAILLNFCRRPLPGFWDLVGGTFFLLVLGGGHLACGTLLLWRNRVILDRRRAVVQTRTGWLGVVRHRFPLSRFDSVSIRPTAQRNVWSRDVITHEVVLSGENVDPIVIGKASNGELAAEIEFEVKEFLEPI